MKRLDRINVLAVFLFALFISLVFLLTLGCNGSESGPTGPDAVTEAKPKPDICQRPPFNCGPSNNGCYRLYDLNGGPGIEYVCSYPGRSGQTKKTDDPPCYILDEFDRGMESPRHPPCPDRMFVTPTAPRVRPTPRVIVR